MVIDGTELNIKFIALPDSQYELKTTVDTTTRLANLLGKVYLGDDYSTLYVSSVHETLEKFFNTLRRVSQPESITLDYVDYIWRDNTWRNVNGNTLISNLKVGS